MLRNLRTFALVGLACTTAMAAPAYAVTFAGDYTVTSNSGDGLIVETQKVADLTSGFTLNNAGDSKTYSPLFTISTPEADVGKDDLVAKAISVAFNFTSPEGFGGTMNGGTVGQSFDFLFFKGFLQNGVVAWDNLGTSTFDFGNGGQLQVKLDNFVNFGTGLFGLSGSKGNVGATFTLLSDSTPIKQPEGPVTPGGTGAVPEPANWAMMIAGFGMIGGAMRSRRSKTSVSFA
jgi:hypothetical protein